MNVLVLNCGSSSVKFQLIATDLERIEQDADKRLAHGLIERIGGAGIVTFTAEGKTPKRYLAAMNGAEAIVFTGGIGENAAEIRAMICADLTWLGVELIRK